jgi:hypothetical protein
VRTNNNESLFAQYRDLTTQEHSAKLEHSKVMARDHDITVRRFYRTFSIPVLIQLLYRVLVWCAHRLTAPNLVFIVAVCVDRQHRRHCPHVYLHVCL